MIFLHIFVSTYNKHGMKKITTSKQFRLTGNETVDGLLFAMIVGALMFVQQSLDAGELTFKWKSVGMAAVASGFVYLIRKFTNKPKVIVTTETNTDAETLKKTLDK